MKTSTSNRYSHHQPIDDDGGPPSPESESVFAFALIRVAVAQTCESLCFKRAQSPALQALAHLAVLYLESIGNAAASSANRHGRTESNLTDIICALEDLAAVQGFAGSSSLRSRSLYTSPVIKGLMRFVKYTYEIPFAQPLPRGKLFFKGARWNYLNFGVRDNNCFYGGGLSYVPRWLPPVPAVGKAVEEKTREPKWGCLDERGKENAMGVAVEREGEIGTPLLGRRERVRFRLGVGIRNGGDVNGGGDMGKRFCARGWSEETEINVENMLQKQSKNGFFV